VQAVELLEAIPDAALTQAEVNGRNASVVHENVGRHICVGVRIIYLARDYDDRLRTPPRGRAKPLDA